MRFPSFLCLSITGCSMLNHHWQCSPPALCRCAKGKEETFAASFSFSLPHFLPGISSPSYYTSDCGPKLTPPPAAQLNCILLRGIPGAGPPWSPWFPSSSGCSTILWLWAIIGEATEWGDPAAHSSRQPENKKNATQIQLLSGAAFSAEERGEAGKCAYATGIFQAQGKFLHSGRCFHSPRPSTDKKKLLDNTYNSEKTENITVKVGGWEWKPYKNQVLASSVWTNPLICSVK